MDLRLRKIFNLGRKGLQRQQLPAISRSVQLHSRLAWDSLFLDADLDRTAVDAIPASLFVRRHGRGLGGF